MVGSWPVVSGIAGPRLAEALLARYRRNFGTTVTDVLMFKWKRGGRPLRRGRPRSVTLVARWNANRKVSCQQH